MGIRLIGLIVVIVVVLSGRYMVAVLNDANERIEAEHACIAELISLQVERRNIIVEAGTCSRKE